MCIIPFNLNFICTAILARPHALWRAVLREGFNWDSELPFTAGFPRPTRPAGVEMHHGRLRAWAVLHARVDTPAGNAPAWTWPQRHTARMARCSVTSKANVVTAGGPRGSRSHRSARLGARCCRGGPFVPLWAAGLRPARTWARACSSRRSRAACWSCGCSCSGVPAVARSLLAKPAHEVFMQKLQLHNPAVALQTCIRR